MSTSRDSCVSPRVTHAIQAPEFLVGPPGSGAPFYPIQAGIDAAVAAAGGERTLANPALVRVLPGLYPDPVVRLHKHIHVWGSGTKDEAISSVASGYVLVDLAADPGAFVEWRGMGVNAPAGAPAGILFTGSNPQALGLQDDVVIGQAPGIVMNNTSLVNSTVEASLIQVAPSIGLFPAVSQDSGLFKAGYSEFYQSNLIGGESQTVLRFGPETPGARSLFAAVDYCAISGVIVVDGSRSTAVGAGSISVNLFYCGQVTYIDAVAAPLITTTGAATPGVVVVSLGYHFLGPDKWVAGSPAILGNAGFSSVVVQNAAVTGRGLSNNVPFISLCDGTYAVSSPIPLVS